MQRLSGIDASFLYFETPTQHLHVSAVIVIDPSTVPGEGYSFERVKELLRSRLHLVPQFRRRLVSVPFNLDHPIWISDADFDLDYHVRRIGCPAPGTEEQLAEIAADIAGRPLDRTRPLWEIWVVEGLENGHVGVVTKMHHCTVDGVSGANLMVHLLDLEPEPAPKPEPEEGWEPERKPSDAELFARAAVQRVVRPVRILGVIPRTVRSVASFIATRRKQEAGMPAPLTAPRTSFNGAITAHRKVAMARVPLEDIKVVKRAFGTTVNDVVLAVVGGSLRRYLQQRGELPDRTLIATCPVSVRSDEHDKQVANKVSAMFTTLRTDLEDPVDRLRAINAVNRGAKEEHKAIGADTLQKWAEFAAPTTFSLASRLYSWMKLAERHPVVHNLVVSNVPGPPIPLYFAGAKLVALYPLGPVFHGAGLNVTVVSYMDSVFFGLIACREAAPQLWELVAAVPDALAELRKAAEAVTPS